MTNRECQRRLHGALCEWRPTVSFDDLLGALQQPREHTAAMAFPARRGTTGRWIPWVAAACLAVLVGGALLFGRGGDPAPAVDTVSARIDIDVNPGIELSINGADEIVAADGANPDGRQVLDGLDLSRQTLSAAVQTLFRSLIDHGYVAGSDNPVLVTVQNADPEEAARLHGIVNDGVDAVMEQHQLSASVTNQTVEAFDAVAQFARTHGISNGKAAFVLSIAEQQPTLDADALSAYSFAALAAIAQHQAIPLSELVDYDAESGLWPAILDALSAEVARAEAALGVSLLTPEQARRAALEALPNDWIAENALFVRVDLVWEGDTPVYRLEMVSDGYLYEYAVSAVDGQFMAPDGTTTTAHNGTVRSTLEGGGTRTNIDIPPTKTTTTEPPTTTVPTQVDEGISDEQAKAIVFSRLEMEEREASNIRVSRLEHTPQRHLISVRFVYRETVYMYHLNKSTGDILRLFSMSQEIPTEAFHIDEWDALYIAIAQAGRQMDACGEQLVRMDIDEEGMPYFEVIFEADGIRYKYRISGNDGTVLAANSAPTGDEPILTPPGMGVNE